MCKKCAIMGKLHCCKITATTTYYKREKKICEKERGKPKEIQLIKNYFQLTSARAVFHYIVFMKYVKSPYFAFPV